MLNNFPDEPDLHAPKLKGTLPLIVIACGGGAMLLSFGLCGLAASVYRIRLPFVAHSGVILFFISIAAILIGAFWLLIIGIMNLFRS